MLFLKIKRFFLSKEIKLALKYIDELDYEYGNLDFSKIVKYIKDILIKYPKELTNFINTWKSIEYYVNLEICNLIKKTLLKWKVIFLYTWIHWRDYWLYLLEIYDKLTIKSINSWYITKKEWDLDTTIFLRELRKYKKSTEKYIKNSDFPIDEFYYDTNFDFSDVPRLKKNI